MGFLQGNANANLMYYVEITVVMRFLFRNFVDTSTNYITNAIEFDYGQISSFL